MHQPALPSPEIPLQKLAQTKGRKSRQAHDLREIQTVVLHSRASSSLPAKADLHQSENRCRATLLNIESECCPEATP